MKRTSKNINPFVAALVCFCATFTTGCAGGEAVNQPMVAEASSQSAAHKTDLTPNVAISAYRSELSQDVQTLEYWERMKEQRYLEAQEAIARVEEETAKAEEKVRLAQEAQDRYEELLHSLDDAEYEAYSLRKSN